MINIPRRPESNLWLLNSDGSAIPLNTFLVERDMEDDVPRLFRSAPKVKAGYTVANKLRDWK